ncbi:SDR family oxidoreductase [Anianabacter salinae]|uniref:SDR family oxidoreductase n=1 Tax=Anianabacter salinae TaxID=2851023 RepID=UPI00225DF7F5|nr:SDR family oxidoreductase [Anianabacter salinae]MBV0914162.1 SDR family oxidoreductase [Anianabacter salinae]
MPRRLLITGGSGLLGLNWALAKRQEWEVTRVEHARQLQLSGTKAMQIDLSDTAAIRQGLEQAAPDLVVHTAGLTNVETCEADPDLAMALNAQASGKIAETCARLGVPLVAISTDHLFGKAPGPYTEASEQTPLNVYAASKAAGERAIQEAFPKALVARTNFFGWGPSFKPSFSDVILHGLRSGQPLSLFDDVVFSPILMERLIEVAHRLVDQGAHGVFNLVGEETVTKHLFGCRLADHFGLPRELISAGKLSAKLDLVTRPHDMGLTTGKLRAALGEPVGDLDAFFSALKRAETAPLTQEIQAL